MPKFLSCHVNTLSHRQTLTDYTVQFTVPYKTFLKCDFHQMYSNTYLWPIFMTQVTFHTIQDTWKEKYLCDFKIPVQVLNSNQNKRGFNLGFATKGQAQIPAMTSGVIASFLNSKAAYQSNTPTHLSTVSEPGIIARCLHN